jgi:[ribosomal protein S18]-alanine N-acetyltransferase
VSFWSNVLGRFRRAKPAARIAPLGTEHAGRLAAIHGQAFRQPWSAVDIEGLLAQRQVLCDGLFLGHRTEPDGFVLSRIVADEAEILSVAMAPDARGKRHAGPLLTHHLEELVRAGARTIHLEVEESNAPALAVYRRLGFREVGRREGYYGNTDGTRTAALTMSRTL